jgi:hypothetical protein
MLTIFNPEGRTRILFAFAAILCLLRLVDLNSAPFLNDEAQLQLLVDQHLRNHTVPLVGLMGTHAIHYGPAALWLYLPIRLVTDQVNTIIACYAAVLIAGHWLLVAAVWKSAGKEVSAWVAAFIAASPYLVFYSRLPWDNTFLIPLTALLCFSVVWIDRGLGVIPWLLLGFAGGLIVDLHLMALPVLLAALLTLLPTLVGRVGRPETRRSVIRGAAIGGTMFLALVIPYFSQVWSELSSGHQFDPTLPHIGTGWEFAPRYFSWTGMGYFLEGPGNFRAMVFGGGLLGKLFYVDPSYVLRIAAWVLLPLTGWRMIRRWNSVPAIQRMAFFCFALLLVYYGGLDMNMRHPHYFLPIWWVMIFFGAVSLTETRAVARVVLASAAVLTLAMNLVFIIAAHAWIAGNHGTRGQHYGSVHAELEHAVSGICSDIAARRGPEADPVNRAPVPLSIRVSEETAVFPLPIAYYVNHEPACLGVAVWVLADRPAAGIERFEIRYSDSDELSARLAWRRLLQSAPAGQPATLR